MPQRPKKVQRPWVRERKPFERERSRTAFDYNDRKWRKKRKAQLDKHPLCVECEKENIVTAASVADHIVRIEDGGDPWSDDNLQSLCKKHHDSKSGREAHRRGGMG